MTRWRCVVRALALGPWPRRGPIGTALTFQNRHVLERCGPIGKGFDLSESPCFGATWSDREGLDPKQSYRLRVALV